MKRRATGEAARDACAEVMLGVSLEDELDEIRDVDTTPVVVPNQPGGSIREAAEAAAAARANLARPATAAAPAPVEDVVDGAVVEDEPIDRETVRNLNIEMTKAGLKTRADKHAYIGRVLGTAIESSSDLTKGQAAAVFADLASTPAPAAQRGTAEELDRGYLMDAIAKAAHAAGVTLEQLESRAVAMGAASVDALDDAGLSTMLADLRADAGDGAP